MGSLGGSVPATPLATGGTSDLLGSSPQATAPVLAVGATTLGCGELSVPSGSPSGKPNLGAMNRRPRQRPVVSKFHTCPVGTALHSVSEEHGRVIAKAAGDCTSPSQNSDWLQGGAALIDASALGAAISSL